jgi:hypothetical protein
MYNNGDIMYSDSIKNGLLKAYAIDPNIFNQNRKKFGTNLGNYEIFLIKCNFLKLFFDFSQKIKFRK